MTLLIRQGYVISPVTDGGKQCDLYLENGQLLQIEDHLDLPADEVIDASGLSICAGLVDMHVHLRDPGFTYKETIETGAAAAARGGVTSVACMPNTAPVVDCPEQIEYIKKKAAQACGVHIYPIGAVSFGEKGESLTDAEALKNAGAVALSDDGMPVQNANLMRDALIRANLQGLSILSHCEDATMVDGRAVNEGRVSRQLWLEGRPAIAEELMVMRDAMLAEETGAAVHICHVSTAGSVDIIRRMKRRGVRITCETCPQYFTLTEDEILTQGAMARVNPPLRTQNDVDAIIAGLKDGTIDVIATDHAPHADEEKARGLVKAPSGMVGLETLFAVTLTELYHTGKMSLLELIKKMTVNPAEILHINRGKLCAGCAADLILFDPEEKWVVDPEKFSSMGHNTPFAGRVVTGRVKCTVAGGKVIYRE